MKISREQFLQAAEKEGLSKAQREALWASLEQGKSYDPFSFSAWMFYFGALVILTGMGWFLSFNWSRFGGGSLFIIATAYGALFAFIGNILWKKPELKTPAGLLVTLAVCMVPLAIYGVEDYFEMGVHSESVFREISMEVGTLVAGLFALRFFSFPFLMAPIYLSAWLLAIDGIPALLEKEDSWKMKEWVTLVLGLVIMGIAFATDKGKRQDYAFWGYLFGTLAFWMGLSSISWSGGEGSLFVYLLINILLMMASILLRRKVLMVFGAVGAFIYLTHLADEIFQDSPLFPLAVSIVGMLIIYLGILYQKNAHQIEKKMTASLPSWMKIYLARFDE